LNFGIFVQAKNYYDNSLAEKETKMVGKSMKKPGYALPKHCHNRVQNPLKSYQAVDLNKSQVTPLSDLKATFAV